jgi:hypothetical protein
MPLNKGEFDFQILNRPKTHTENHICLCTVCKEPIMDCERIIIELSVRGRKKVVENHHLKCHQKIVECYLDKYKPDWRTEGKDASKS